MTDVPALMNLARELNLDEALTKNFGLLSTSDKARAAELGSGPEQRLAMGCSFLGPLHEASLATLTNDEWRIPTTGQTVRHLTLPGMSVSYPLPACSFEEQITTCIYMPELGSSLFGSYDNINVDEVQDLTPAKALATLKMIEDSNRNGGPRHRTRLRIVGDSDQSINGYLGSFIDGVAGVRRFLQQHGIGSVHDSTLTCSLRCPKAIVAYSTETLTAAFDNYAKDADPGRSPTKPLMQALPDAAEGTVVHQATFITHPPEDVLNISPTTIVGCISRRHLEIKCSCR